MKSKLFSFTAVLVMMILATSCGKLEKVLVKKDGKWNIASAHSHSSTHTVDTSLGIDQTTTFDTTYADYGTITFTDDNMGTMTVDSMTTAFSWSVNDDGSEITFITSTTPPDTATYDVEENSKNEQKWSSNVNDVMTFGTTTVTITGTGEWTLERAE